MKRCVECLLPETKPDLWFDEDGTCAACLNFRNRPHVDWEKRREQFREILTDLRGSRAWDCIVPASGGKDSTYQILKIIEEGFRPLAVTSTTCDLSPIGQRNIDNLKKLGVDHIQVSPNPRLRAKLNRFGLEEVGDIAWPEHVGIFTVPVQMAVALNIPVIVWGENSQNEYGGPETAAQAPTLTRRWLEEFGGLLGLRVSDLPDSMGVDARDLELYTYPSDQDLARVGVTGLFLGHYFPWDGMSNTLIAQAKGFETHGRVIEGSAVDYENLDNFQHGIHDYFKFLKFGFGRATDIASMHIRRGRMSREQGMDIARTQDGKYPWTYLDKPLEKILEPLELSLAEFDEICDRFTSRHLFQTDSRGNLVRDRHRNLVLIEEEQPRS